MNKRGGASRDHKLRNPCGVTDGVLRPLLLDGSKIK